MVKAIKSSASHRHDDETVQNNFLKSVINSEAAVTVFLVNGVKLSGNITKFDDQAIVLARDNHSQLVFKHAISTIMPVSPLPIFSRDDDIDDL